MADATSSKDSKKHTHLISIRGNKEVEDALVVLARTEGLTKFEMLSKIIRYYASNVTAKQIIEEKAKEIEEGREKAIQLLSESATRDKALESGLPSDKDKETALVA